MSEKIQYDIIIIGGGASGLFFACNAKKECSKLIIEKSKILGTKILIAGGGRCNYTNIHAGPNTYVGKNTKMLPSYFHAFGPQDMIAWTQTRGMKSKTEALGRVFPRNNKAQTLRDLLVNTAKDNNTHITTETQVTDIIQTKTGFEIQTNNTIYTCKKVIITTGGKTLPNTGTTGFAYDFANKHKIEISGPLMTSLCGIETQQDFSPLSGSSIPARIKVIHNTKPIHQETGNLLFTHRGISGPVVFNTSLYIADYIRNKNKKPETVAECEIEIMPVETTKRIRNFMQVNGYDKEGNITSKLKTFRGRNEAKVTGGGILMKELKQNFESKKIPGLYFLGECLDITGKTGGYSLQRCWTSAYICTKKIEV